VWSGELAGPDAVVGLGASYELDAPRCIIYIQYIYIYIYIVQYIKMSPWCVYENNVLYVEHEKMLEMIKI
jgi:hypothetical protein